MSENQKNSKELSGVALCSAETEELPADFQLHRALKPFLELKTVQEKNISNPYLFRGASMVTTFVRSAGNHTKGMWKFLEKVNQVDIKLAELEHSSLRKIVLLFRQGPDLH